MQKVISEKIIFEGRLKIEEAGIRSGQKEFRRMRLKRPEATAVLVLNSVTNKVILTRQFRYAIHDKTQECLLEIVAGIIDEGEDPKATAIRETMEEIGYRIQMDKLVHISSCFVSPGYTTEKLHLYYVEVTPDDRINAGGGLKDENEEIEIVEMDAEEFSTLVKAGRISDFKTYAAGLWFITRPTV